MIKVLNKATGEYNKTDSENIDYFVDKNKTEYSDSESEIKNQIDWEQKEFDFIFIIFK